MKSNKKSFAENCSGKNSSTKSGCGCGVKSSPSADYEAEEIDIQMSEKD